MRSDSESPVFADFAGEADDEWPTREDLFSSADESMEEFSDEWEFAEADDEYDEFDEAIADESDAELWTETADWGEAGWLTDEFDESVSDHECTHCGQAVALLEAPDEEAPSVRRKLGPCTPVQDDLKPAAPWPEMQQRFRRSCSLLTHRIDPKSAVDCACAFGEPREVAIFAMARVIAAGPLAARLFAHFLRGSGTEVAIDVADMIKRSSGVRNKIRQSVMKGGDTGTLRIEQSDFKNEDLQFAYGAIDCVRWTVEKPAPKNWRKNPAARIKVEMLDYYEFHPGRTGVSQCAHAACVELVARGSAKNFWTSGSAVVTLSQLGGAPAVAPKPSAPRAPRHIEYPSVY